MSIDLLRTADGWYALRDGQAFAVNAKNGKMRWKRKVGALNASSPAWNDADIEKIVSPCWTARTRRVVNERPVRVRSTKKMVASCGRPGRRK